MEWTGHQNKREAAHCPDNCPTKTDSSGWAPMTIATEQWRPTCPCDAGEPVPGLVLDPFVGSGTTCLVARELGRNSVGLDLSYTYLHDQARERLELDAWEAWHEGGQEVEDTWQDGGLPLFRGLEGGDATE